METIRDTKTIEEIVGVLPSIKDKIEETTKEMKKYLECLELEGFEEKETDDETIKRAESIYERLDGVDQIRKTLIEKGKETNEIINEVKMKIEKVVSNCEKGGIYLEEANNELIDKIIELEERKMNKEIDLIKQRFNNKKDGWDMKRFNYEEYKRKKGETNEETKSRMNNTIDINEMKQIEEWTTMKIGNIIFDSDVDNWNVNTSVFHHKIINKTNLIFLVEEEDGNVFGGYINPVIDKCDAWINDPKSFVFSLKSNGRLNGMMKFDVTHPQHAFCLSIATWDGLFGFGPGYVHDIFLFKEHKKKESQCIQNSFNYNGIQNALCGKSFPDRFTPIRITVFQLL